MYGSSTMPDYQQCDAVATARSPGVVAHQIGCRHSVGIMRTDYISGDEALWIDDNARIARCLSGKKRRGRERLRKKSLGRPYFQRLHHRNILDHLRRQPVPPPAGRPESCARSISH
jgi:hypothetical protein